MATPNKYRILTFFAAAATLSLLSCDDTGSYRNNQDVLVAFAPFVAEHTPATRADDGQWTGSETVGIAMLPSERGLTPSDNFTTYTVTRSGTSSSLAPVETDEAICYPASGNKVTFAAFAPFVKANGTMVAYDAFADQKSLEKMEQVDLVYSADNIEYDKTTTDPVELTFTHKFSKLRVLISSIEDYSGADLSTVGGVSLNNLPGSVMVDLATLDMVPGAPTKATEFCCRSTDTTLATYEAIIVPHACGNAYTDRTLTIATEAYGDFTYTLDNTIDFVSGNIYTLRFHITKDGLKETDNALISNWETGAITWDGYTYESPMADAFDIRRNGESHSIAFATTYPGNQVTVSVSYTDEENTGWINIPTGNPVRHTIENSAVNYTCSFTVDPNDGGAPERVAYLMIKVDRMEKIYTITQELGEPPVVLSMEPGAITNFKLFPNIQSDRFFRFKTNARDVTVKWSTSPTDSDAGAPDWASGDLGTPESNQGFKEYTYTYSLTGYTANVETARTAYAHVLTNGEALVFTIEQDCIRFFEVSEASKTIEYESSTSFTFKTNYTDANPTVTAAGYDWIYNLSITKEAGVTGPDVLTKYTCTVYNKKNLSIFDRDGAVTLTAASGLMQDVDISQGSFSLSPASNSYVVFGATQVTAIPVSRANEHAKLSGDASAAIGHTDELEAELLWMDNPGVIQTLEVSGTGSNAAIMVECGWYGNAVVAVKDKASGKIKWSWHIWSVTGDVRYHLLCGWMSRNLGALNDTDPGLYYQWGRKDPFPGATSSGGEPVLYYSLDGSNPGTYSIRTTTSAQTISATVADPELFIAPGNNNSWMIGATATDTNWFSADGLKTIYDPCPEGYRVPASGAWGSAAAGTWSAFTYNGNGYDTGPKYGGWYRVIGGYRSNSTASPGVITGYTNSGFIWTASPSTLYATALQLSTSKATVNPVATKAKSLGYAVRCQAE